MDLTLPVYVETGLTNGDDYEAQVRAINGIGTQTTWSDSGEAEPAAEAPDQIQGVVLGNESTGIRASWGVPQANGTAVTGYTIQWDDNSAFSSPSSASPTATSRLITNLTEGTTYYVRVRARSSAGNGAWSPTESLERDDGRALSDAPAAPTGETLGAEELLWSWDIPDDDGGAMITSYDHQWRVDGTGWSGNITTGITTGCRRVDGLTAGEDYQARVRARNSVGVSAWSAASAAVTAEEEVTDQWAATRTYEHPVLAIGSDGNVYKSKQDTGPPGTARNPVTDTTDTYWELLLGTAATRDTGTVSGRVALLGSGGRFDEDRVPDIEDLNGTLPVGDTSGDLPWTRLSGVPDSSATESGIIETATTPEGVAGTSASLALTPAGGRAHGDARYPIVSGVYDYDGTGTQNDVYDLLAPLVPTNADAVPVFGWYKPVGANAFDYDLPFSVNRANSQRIEIYVYNTSQSMEDNIPAVTGSTVSFTTPFHIVVW